MCISSTRVNRLSGGPPADGGDAADNSVQLDSVTFSGQTAPVTIAMNAIVVPSAFALKLGAKVLARAG